MMLRTVSNGFSNLRKPMMVMGSSARNLSFDISDTQKQLQQMAFDFAKKEMIPIEKHHDKTGEWPAELRKKAFELGLCNAFVPSEYGGVGANMLDSVIATEALAYGCSGIGLAIAGSHLPGMSVLLCANEEQKKKYLGLLASGPHTAALCVTEPVAGSDVAGTKTKATKEGDEYVLNGSKCWITGGGPASFFVVLARTDPNPKAPPSKAFTVFIVDGDTPGIVRGKKELNLGQRASDTRSITFENVRVKKENVIGKEGGGFGVIMRTFDGTRPLVAAMGCGISSRAYEEAVKYSLERETFGTKIANHQAIQFLLADMAIEFEQFRTMTYKAAVYFDEKRPNATYFASISKVSSADQTQKIVSNAVQIFGGAGFNSEYPVEKLMRDAKILQIYEGTSQIQKMIIARLLIQHYQDNRSVLVN